MHKLRLDGRHAGYWDSQRPPDRELQADSPSEQAQHIEEYLRGRLSVLVFPCLL
jgi:hypothetical protein